ncbi:MAG: carbohydrate kinase family protein [Anaerolineae bacterium]|nr:carbohydrate kinase family protein [Anaerolineae bacterium]
MNIVVTGSIAFDYLMHFPGDFLQHVKPDRLQKLSLSFLVDEMVKQRGGCAPNIAYSLALLGERPRIMGTAGQDFESYRLWLEANGVDTSAIKIVPDVFTASFFATTDQHLNQIASFYTGAMAYARDLSFRDLTGPVDLTIISPNDPDAMDRYAWECKELGIPYIYDPSQQVVRAEPVCLSNGVIGADILVVNDYEYELLKDCTEMTDADIRKAVTRAVVVTLGEKGARIWADDEEIAVPVAPVKVILDPTGVGDAFRSGLIKGLALGLPLAACGRIGSVAAAYVLETKGPQAHRYTIPEFVARYADAFGEDEATATLRAA